MRANNTLPNHYNVNIAILSHHRSDETQHVTPPAATSQYVTQSTVNTQPIDGRRLLPACLVVGHRRQDISVERRESHLLDGVSMSLHSGAGGQAGRRAINHSHTGPSQQVGFA